MIDPREVVPQSIMPAYPWLLTRKRDDSNLQRKIQVMKDLGVPYTDQDVRLAPQLASEQAKRIADNLLSEGAPQGIENREIVGLIAYLQRLGKDWKTFQENQTKPGTGANK